MVSGEQLSVREPFRPRSGPDLYFRKIPLIAGAWRKMKLGTETNWEANAVALMKDNKDLN